MTDSRADETSDVVVPPPLPAAEPPPVPSGPLQFDTAEFSQPTSMACNGCQQPITTEYYAVNGATLCVPCSGGVRGEKGGRLLRAIRAAVAGSVAAFAGGLLYFLIVYIWDFQLGLIAIAVGFAVGAAVRWGSYGRGGAAYQAMAMSLTYLSIVASLLLAGLLLIANEQPNAGKDIKTAASSAATPAAAPTSLATNKSSLNGDAGSGESEPGLLISLVMLFGIMLALPFLSGVENIMGIVIMAVGLYQAWKLNKRPEVTGPHPIRASDAHAAS